MLFWWDIGKPIGEDEDGEVVVAEDLFPGDQAGDVVAGGPGFGAVAAEEGAGGDLSALDVGEDLGTLRGIEDEVEALDFGAGEDGLFGLVHGDIGDVPLLEVGLEGAFVMGASSGHGISSDISMLESYN